MKIKIRVQTKLPHSLYTWFAHYIFIVSWLLKNDHYHCYFHVTFKKKKKKNTCYVLHYLSRLGYILHIVKHIVMKHSYSLLSFPSLSFLHRAPRFARISPSFGKRASKQSFQKLVPVLPMSQRDVFNAPFVRG